MPKSVSRRDVLKAGGAALGGGLLHSASLDSKEILEMDKPIMGEPFKLKYAPHFGMFGNHGGEDLVDQLKFAADVGFRAWEDNGMMGKEIALQERLAKAMTELDIEMGVFVADADFGTTKYVDYNPSKAPEFRKIAHEAVEVAKRVNRAGQVE